MDQLTSNITQGDEDIDCMCWALSAADTTERNDRSDHIVRLDLTQCLCLSTSGRQNETYLQLPPEEVGTVTMPWLERFEVAYINIKMT